MVFDDYPNLVRNSRLHIDSLTPDALWHAALSGESGPVKRPISMLTFAVNYATSGNNDFAFKATNLAIHLINGLLLALLTFYLARMARAPTSLDERKAAWLALLVAAVWLLHPINLTAVLYTVQRMTSLSATFVLAGLLAHLLIRESLGRRKAASLIGMAVSMLVFTTLAVLCKENGALLPLFILATEFCLLAPPHGVSHMAHRRAVVVTGSVLLAVGTALLIAKSDRIFGGYDNRPYTAPERLLTQSRALIWYLQQILVPQINEFSLMHDDFRISRSLLEPITTLFATLALAAMAVLAIVARHRAPIVTFGIVWFFVGHLLESTLVPLELVYEHRNYLPSIGILLPVAWLGTKLPKALPSINPAYAIALLVTWPLAMGIVTFTRSSGWQDILTWSMYQVRHNPDSPRNHFFAGSLFASWAPRAGDPFKVGEYIYRANEHFQKAQKLSHDGMPSASIARIRLDSTFEKDIDDNRVENLIAQLEDDPLSASTQTALQDLTDCMIENVCRISENEYFSIYESALDNPDISDGARNALFAKLSDYYASQNNHAAAIGFAKRAAKDGRFRPEYGFLLARRLVEGGQLNQARRILDEIDAVDSWAAYDLQIKRWRNRIDELEERNNVPPGSGRQLPETGL